MNTVELFEKNRYVHLQDFLAPESCHELTESLKSLVKEQQTTKDPQCPLSEAVHGAVAFDKLLVDLLPHFEAASGKKLYPTYSYARLYAPGDELKHHTDRPSCEISATLTLGFEGEVWPIFMGNEDKTIKNKIKMKVGDAVLYRGCEVHHWRKKYKEGQWQAQVFLHYVDANGPHAEWKFDKRPGLNLPGPAELRDWVFNDILTPEACDMLIKLYTKDVIPKEPPVIGSGTGTVNKAIRNVERVMLPTYKDIGGRLAAAGLSANQSAWKFNITHANQAEFLIYPAGGRYVSHTDTFLHHSDDTRKLTVLAFLNDDFKGGKFYLMNGHEKYYPPQKKGTVIVFPSFIMHGVEDVEEGQRCSVVTWMVGPFFK
jgi:predicted 2-oxoglutarate/Fe(II)-dependent dioxygenase YbiX